jgi:hypothetical protein
VKVVSFVLTHWTNVWRSFPLSEVKIFRLFPFKFSLFNIRFGIQTTVFVLTLRFIPVNRLFFQRILSFTRKKVFPFHLDDWLMTVFSPNLKLFFDYF